MAAGNRTGNGTSCFVNTKRVCPWCIVTFSPRKWTSDTSDALRHAVLWGAAHATMLICRCLPHNETGWEVKRTVRGMRRKQHGGPHVYTKIARRHGGGAHTESSCRVSNMHCCGNDNRPRLRWWSHPCCGGFPASRFRCGSCRAANRSGCAVDDAAPQHTKMGLLGHSPTVSKHPLARAVLCHLQDGCFLARLRAHLAGCSPCRRLRRRRIRPVLANLPCQKQGPRCTMAYPKEAKRTPTEVLPNAEMSSQRQREEAIKTGAGKANHNTFFYPPHSFSNSDSKDPVATHTKNGSPDVHPADCCCLSRRPRGVQQARTASPAPRCHWPLPRCRGEPACLRMSSPCAVAGSPPHSLPAFLPALPFSLCPLSIS